MINKFLKAKHWQLFLLMVVVPFIIQVYTMFSSILEIIKTRNQNPFAMLSHMEYYPLMLPFLLFFYGWLWALAMYFEKRVPENLKMKSSLFKLFFFLAVVLVSCNLLFFVPMMIKEMPHNLFAFLPFIPLSLFSVFCVVYCLYFTAKSIKMAELQRDIKFDDYAAEFFLMWFYPVGVWILQPKINKMVEENIL